MAAIETEDLSKDFHVGFWRPRPYRALESLTLTVGEGELFGFLGPNGAGKSTTLKLLLQLLYPTSGLARVLGRPAGDVGVRRRIGFLPENPSFYDYLTAEELLSYFTRLFGVRGAEVGARVARALDDVGIGAERRLKLRQYSKGMIQRVGLAQALLNDPELVFLDEPMSGLDPLGRRQVRQLMLRLRDRGCTVFFSSHILSDAEALCSQVAIVVQGRLVASGRVADIQDFRIRGWELVMSQVSPEARQELERRGLTMTTLDRDRITVELPPDSEPVGLVNELAGRGAALVSLNPVRETLEDYFVAKVAAAAPRDTSGL